MNLSSADHDDAAEDGRRHNEIYHDMTGTEGGAAEPGGFESAERSIVSDDLAADIAKFEADGYRLDLIRPADNPTQALMSRRYATIRIHVGDADAGESRSDAIDVNEVGNQAPRRSPGGTTLEDGHSRHSPHAGYPGPFGTRLTISRLSEAEFGVGRAGMTYRDLLPGRNGGRVIASHIRIDEGGSVADYVHYHEIEFQVIFCLSGWVEVVYECQGAPFRLLPGDCVLQPPGIRHRVLRCSPGLEVVEIGSPANHDTRVDHDLDLPTVIVDGEREFGGQMFVHHRGDRSQWRPWTHPGFEFKGTGVADATRGTGSVEVIRPTGGARSPIDVDLEVGEHGFLFGFLRSGECVLGTGGSKGEALQRGDSFSSSGPAIHSLRECSHDLEVLLVCLPEHLSAFPNVPTPRRVGSG